MTVAICEDFALCRLLFGIPSLDLLVNPRDGYFDTGAEAGVVCIMGSDGVGKSILALHLASAFWADQRDGKRGAIFYVSTDLKYSQAHRTWRAFGLNYPKQRADVIRSTFSQGLELREGTSPVVEGCLKLHWIAPTREGVPVVHDNGSGIATRTQSHDASPHPLKYALLAENWRSAVQFIDLSTFSAGDDWHLMNRLTGVLAGQSALAVNSTPNLIVVDAVEGLEAMVGERDLFGELRSRRSRIAQLGRLAKRANAHLIFVIEEAVSDAIQPEQYVADLVIRLRSVKDRDYDRRTVEIEKARGVSHTRGQHDVAIRLGAARRAKATKTTTIPRLLSHQRTTVLKTPTTPNISPTFKCFAHCMFGTE